MVGVNGSGLGGFGNDLSGFWAVVRGFERAVFVALRRGREMVRGLGCGLELGCQLTWYRRGKGKGKGEVSVAFCLAWRCGVDGIGDDVAASHGPMPEL